MRLTLILACVVGIGCVEIGNFSLGDNATFGNISSSEQTVGDALTTSGTPTVIPPNTTAPIPDESTTGNLTVTASTQEQTTTETQPAAVLPTTTETQTAAVLPTTTQEQSTTQTQPATVLPTTTQDQSTTQPATVLPTTTQQDQSTTQTQHVTSLQTTGVTQTSTGTRAVLVSPTTVLSSPTAVHRITSTSWQIKKITTSAATTTTTQSVHPTSASTAHHKWHDTQRGQHPLSRNWFVFFCGLVVGMCVFAF